MRRRAPAEMAAPPIPQISSEKEASMNPSSPPVLDPPEPLVIETRRINLNLATKTYDDLQILCKARSRTMTDLIRFGLALVKLYFEEQDKGNLLTVSTREGKAIREIIFPD